jgi:hypothetical protein
MEGHMEGHMEKRRTRPTAMLRWALIGGAVLCTGLVDAQDTAFVFDPKPTTVLGSNEAGASGAFTRIFNQAKGELAIKDGAFMASGGLALNWPVVLRNVARPAPILGYMSRLVGRDVVQMVIRVNLAHSDLANKEIAVDFVVTEGTTLPIPVGTVFGGAFWRVVPGGIAGHGGFVTGILPDTNEEASTLTFLILPGVIRNPSRAGRIDIEYSFVSVAPPDGSPALTATPRETLSIVPPSESGRDRR